MILTLLQAWIRKLKIVLRKMTKGKGWATANERTSGIFPIVHETQST